MDIKEPQSVNAPYKSNIWMWISILLLLCLIGIGGYMLGKNQSLPAQIPPVLSPTSAITTTVSVPTTSPNFATGSISGKLCYPASLVPKGTITAKNATTGELTTQNYPGTQSGASTTYTFTLKVGTYHMKFAPADYPTVIGYYTNYSACVSDPSGPDCTGQQTRPLLPVTVVAGGTVSDINICDYYYFPDNPPQF